MEYERELEQHLRNRMREIGGEVRKVQWIGRRGAPDDLVLFPAHFKRPPLFLELKRPGGSLSLTQNYEIERMRALGCWVEVVSSLEALDRVLEAA